MSITSRFNELQGKEKTRRKKGKGKIKKKERKIRNYERYTLFRSSFNIN